ncbi:MAG: histidine phosphatase family protein [Pseudomonadota bacterium]
MPSLVRYLSHPEVEIDPSIAVPSWSLSAKGHARVEALIDAGWLAGTTQIIASAEPKAIETAGPIAAALGVEVEIREAMHENDRSATGFLPGDEFERVADAFFAQPMASVRGWERAIDAQARIVREAETVLDRKQAGDLLFIGHGAVGTLLFCHYAGRTISRRHDQPGPGHYFSFLKKQRRVLHRWRALEEPPAHRTVTTG